METIHSFLVAHKVFHVLDISYFVEPYQYSINCMLDFGSGLASNLGFAGYKQFRINTNKNEGASNVLLSVDHHIANASSPEFARCVKRSIHLFILPAQRYARNECNERLCE